MPSPLAQLWQGIAMHGATVATALGAALFASTAGTSPGTVVKLCLGAAAVSAPVARLLARSSRRGGSWAALPLGLVLVAAVGLRASQDLAGLAEPLADHVDGIAQLGSDPQRDTYGVTAELVAGGRRWLAEFGRDTEAAVAPLMTGDRLQVVGSTSEFRDAPEGWVRSRHLAGRVEIESAEALQGTSPWYAAANTVHRLLDRGSASMSEQHRALYLGLVVGDDRGQDEMTRFRFRASGLTHLLAVSGQNIAFVLVALSPLLSRLTFRWRWVLGAAAIVGFVLVTRAEPSVLRAAVMAVLALTAMTVGRATSGVRLLSIAVSVLLVADPMLVHSVGFRLSVAATAGLVLLAKPLRRWLPGPDWLAAPLAVTLAAQLGAVPVMVTTFGPVSVLAIPANLLAEPAAGLVMTSGLTAGLAAGVVREEVAWLLQAPARMAVWWVDSVASATAGLSAPPLGLLGWVAVLAGGGAAVLLWRQRGRIAMGRVAALAVLPTALLLRPPLAGAGIERVPLDHGELRACGSVWVVVVEDPVDPRTAAEVTESLWQLGLARISTVSAPTDTATVHDLADRLGAELHVRPEQGRPSPMASSRTVPEQWGNSC